MAEALMEKYLPLMEEVGAEIKPLLEKVDFRNLWPTNKSLSHYAENPYRILIEAERGNYAIACEWITETLPKGSKIYDLGTFVPFLPVMLSNLGYKVVVCEKWSFYGPTLEKQVRETTARNGIDVMDIDMVTHDMSFLNDGDMALLMAVVEHFNGSPKSLLTRIHDNLPEHGQFLFSVPNIADLPKRLRLLKGRSPLPVYADYYESDYPFTGHNREMTMDEVHYALAHAGFAVKRQACLDYTAAGGSWKEKTLQLAKNILPLSDHRESIFALSGKA